MNGKHTLEELNQLSREELVTVILTMQGQLDALNENIERLIEQVRIANQHRFGRKTETMQSIEGQLSFFNEAEAFYDKDAKEPDLSTGVTCALASRSPPIIISSMSARFRGLHVNLVEWCMLLIPAPGRRQRQKQADL